LVAIARTSSGDTADRVGDSVVKLRLTLNRAGQESVDLAITYDSSATVGDVADHLYVADPLAAGRGEAPIGLTLAAIAGDRQAALTPETPLAESGLHSAQTVSLVRAGEKYVEQQSAKAAVLRVVEGPDQGQDFALVSGSNVIGRGRSCDVRLTDLLVSRQHIRVNVGDRVEVIDMGSANGLSINGVAAEREVLQLNDQVTIGDTTFTVRMLQSAATQGRVETTAVAFIRSPRLVSIYGGEKFEAPEVPEYPKPMRFPTLATLAPMLMGAVLWWVTRDLMSLLFMALSPLMMLGSYLDQVITGKADYKRALKQWRKEVQSLCDDIEIANAKEVTSRLIEHPSVAECVQATEGLSNLLWTRRPDSPGFCEFRFGLGSVSARSQVMMPDAARASRSVYAELVTAVTPLQMVHNVPVVMVPGTLGGFGVAGPSETSTAAARAIVVQAAALHSPDELVIAAVASATTCRAWEWLKWLPHCASAKSPLDVHLGSSALGAAGVLGSIESLIADRQPIGKEGIIPTPAVLLVVESDAPAEFGRLVALAETGWRHGVFVLWVAAELSMLPASCRVFLEIGAQTDPRVGFLHDGAEISPVAVETIPLEITARWARTLSPVTDLAARSDDASDVPRSVNLLALPGFDPMIESVHVIERWQANRSIVVGPLAPEKPSGKAGNLRAVIGQSALGPHSLDLRTDGPHALVGGTTGSGKSELLQTWILAMAATHSPQRLNFLLVDYKGGSAFADCNNLPHTVGLVTDLNKNGVRRALTSLAAELHYRERLITEQHRCKDLPTMEKKFPALAPPSLVMVIDEFAALVQEVPEFIDGVVNVAQRGRSLGLHMILATQQPSGVIKGPLRANTNLRLALRVADVDDSNDILGSPQAAYFDQDAPGRAVSKTGPGRLVPFQTGYVGGHTGLGTVRSEVEVAELRFGSREVWERPVEEDSAADRGPADISRIVSAIQHAASAAELPSPRKPWLPDLKDHYDLAKEVPTRRSDTELVYGMLDDPDRQRQIPVAFHPDVEGNLIVYGASGSGKTTLLRTLAVAAGFTVRGGPCHVYGLDFASRGLDMLETMPHVGSIINGSDDERIERLMNWLRALVTERSARYQQVAASTITDYRHLAGKPHEPRILVLIDGVAAFRTAYEGGAKTKYFDMLAEIAAQGRPVGVHFVMSSDQRGGMPVSLAASVQRRIVMRMADPEDYGSLATPLGILDPDSPPGRCVVDDAEVQVAVLGAGSDAQAQAGALDKFATAMRNSALIPAPPIRRLPEQVSGKQLAHSADLVTIGMTSEGFGAAQVSPSGPFVVTGPVGSGRTTAVKVIVAELHRVGMPVHLLADRRSELASAPGWDSVIVGAESIMLAVEELSALFQTTRPSGLIIEGLGELTNSEAEFGLADLIGIALAAGHFVVAEGEYNNLSQSYDLMKRFKAGRRGLVLQPSDGMEHLFQAGFPRCQSTDFCAGRGFLVERGMPSVVQVSMPS
jgi:DNA segregation ATPase FtsK/SpoIIIE, S-DNA-T family